MRWTFSFVGRYVYHQPTQVMFALIDCNNFYVPSIGQWTGLQKTLGDSLTRGDDEGVFVIHFSPLLRIALAENNYRLRESLAQFSGPCDGIEAIQQIKNMFSEIQVLVQSVFDDKGKIFRTIRARASGNLLKNTLPAPNWRQCIAYWQPSISAFE